MAAEVGAERKALQEAAAIHLLAAAKAAKEWADLDDQIDEVAARRRAAYERERLALLAYSQFRLSTSEVWPQLVERDRPPRIMELIDRYLQDGRQGRRGSYEEHVPPSRRWAEATVIGVDWKTRTVQLQFAERPPAPDRTVTVSWADPEVGSSAADVADAAEVTGA